MKVIAAVFTIFALNFLPNSVSAKRVTGTLTGTENWNYLTRFCFLNGTGTLEFLFRYPKAFLTQSLLLYWDQPNLWRSAYSDKSMTCQQKEALLDIRNNQIFRMNLSSSLCSMENNDTIRCISERIRFLSRRERWWYLAISNCAAKYGIYLHYDVVMRNGEPGEFFKEHFSADELYILEFNIAAFFIELVAVILVVIVSVKLTNMQMFHSTYKIYLSSVTFFFASIISTCVSYMIYATTGYENSGLKNFGSGLYAISQILLVNMLLLLSLGYTVVCGRLPHWGVVCLSIFMTSFVIAYIALYIVEAATFDPALVLYRYESWPGYAIIGIILASWLFYVCACIFTMAKHKKKAPFYAPMLAFYSLWFIAIPVTVAVNMTQVPDYSRAKVVNFIEVISLFLAHGFYLILTWPSLANKNFPFHIRTTQIDVVSFEAAAREAELEEASKESADLADGRQFTNFSIFTVPDQRSSFVPFHGLSSGGGGRSGGGGGGGRSGGGGGGGDSDWDSGVMMSTPAAADATSEADSAAGSATGAARLVEGGVGFNFNSNDAVDGENTDEPPVALTSNDVDETDNRQSETASVQQSDEASPAAAVEGVDEDEQPPRWMLHGPLGGDGGGGGGGRLPPI